MPDSHSGVAPPEAAPPLTDAQLTQRAAILLAVLLAAIVALGVMPADVARPFTDSLAITPSDVIASCAMIAVLAVVALALGRGRRSGLGQGQMPTLRAHVTFERLARWGVPALTAGIVTASHTGREADTVVVAACMLVASTVLHGRRYPLHIVRLARFAFDALMPMLGLGLAYVVGSLSSVETLPANTLFAALICTWAVTFVGGWLEGLFDAERPLRLALVGDPALAGALRDEIHGAGATGHAVVGYLVEDDQVVNHEEATLPCLGTVASARATVEEHDIDLLVLSPLGSRIDLFKELAAACLDTPVRMIEASSMYEEIHGRVPIGRINSAWFQYMMHPNFRPSSPLSKRVFDVGVAAALAVALAPVIALLALLVRLQDRGPAFYRQRRVGEAGHEFDVIKLRSMRVDAESAGAVWSEAEDDRVTSIGRMMRKTHLDELPQLWNVLKGEMSLVGPRPERPEFVQELEQRVPYYERRHLVKPGVTGWAQVHCGYSGSDAGSAYKLCHDLYYIKHRSLLFDILIIVETLRTFVADPQFAAFTFSEVFILGHQAVAEDAVVNGPNAVLGDAAALARHSLFEDSLRPSDGPVAQTAS
jgi:exopolysaccharide biosynthesis polyprenyl glycosylphosphotransferase